MILIVGGGYQGKQKYAEETFHIQPEDWVNGRTCTWTDLYHAKGILHLHKFIQARLAEGEDVSGLAENLLANNPDCVIVSTELGYGIVPMEESDRIYRETVGRICTSLAASAEEVHRVVCGIGMVLKHA